MSDGNRVRHEEHSVKNTSSYDVGRGETQFWDLNSIAEKLNIKIVKYEGMDMEFDIIGINSVFVNAFRRALLTQIPVMAIEKVHMYTNTGVVQDEVLSHRLGLIPLKADARRFKYRTQSDDEFNEDDTLEFELRIKYTEKKDNAPINPKDRTYNTSTVLSEHIRWLPIGDQSKQFKKQDVGPTVSDILIAKLSPGAEIDAKLYAFKGTGSDHAKFQAVGTAYYRLLPQITLLEDIEDERAEQLKTCFSPGVIEVIKDTAGKKKAKVANARYDSGSRNVFRYADFKNAVEISRVPDHFIFTIESLGTYTPDVLFMEAVKSLEDKCDVILKELTKYS